MFQYLHLLVTYSEISSGHFPSLLVSSLNHNPLSWPIADKSLVVLVSKCLSKVRYIAYIQSHSLRSDNWNISAKHYYLIIVFMVLMIESNVNVFSYFSTAQKTVCVCKLKLALSPFCWVPPLVGMGWGTPNPTERTESQSSKFG